MKETCTTQFELKKKIGTILSSNVPGLSNKKQLLQQTQSSVLLEAPSVTFSKLEKTADSLCNSNFVTNATANQQPQQTIPGVTTTTAAIANSKKLRRKSQQPADPTSSNAAIVRKRQAMTGQPTSLDIVVSPKASTQALTKKQP